MGAIVLKVWLYLIEVKMMPMFKVLPIWVLPFMARLNFKKNFSSSPAACKNERNRSKTFEFRLINASIFEFTEPY